jgi:hypothetical protein
MQDEIEDRRLCAITAPAKFPASREFFRVSLTKQLKSKGFLANSRAGAGNFCAGRREFLRGSQGIFARVAGN